MILLAGVSPFRTQFMQVTVKLYGNLKRHMPDKKEIASVELPPGTTIAALLARLGVPDSDVWMSALNDTVVSASTELHDGDVLEIFEPVGGGQGKSMP
jgi:thiamine biosynthesis protein ThiS